MPEKRRSFVAVVKGRNVASEPRDLIAPPWELLAGDLRCPEGQSQATRIPRIRAKCGSSETTRPSKVAAVAAMMQSATGTSRLVQRILPAASAMSGVSEWISSPLISKASHF